MKHSQDLNKYQYKIIRTLFLNSDKFTIEDLSKIDFLYYTIRATPQELKMLYESQYEFPKNQANFTQNV